MPGDFVSEPITPVTGTADTRGMARGEPGLPRQFTWRGAPYTVAEVLESWKTATRCKSGSAEQYVRKHWYRVRTDTGHQMTLYFERQARSARQRKQRWWLYTVSVPGNG